jgi:hypothetical protein
MKERFGFFFLLGVAICEFFLVAHLMLHIHEIKIREQYLIEQNGLLRESRNAERKLYEMREKAFTVCSSLMNSTFTRLGLLRPDGVGNSVIEALSIQPGGDE